MDTKRNESERASGTRTPQPRNGVFPDGWRIRSLTSQPRWIRRGRPNRGADEAAPSKVAQLNVGAAQCRAAVRAGGSQGFPGPWNTYFPPAAVNGDCFIVGMSNSKILVVDDDPSLSRLVAVILNRMGGYDVLEENRSFAALTTARSFRPDLILLDVDMPGKDGGAVAAELGNDPLFAHTPIVFVTSLISKGEAGIRNGERFLSKPVDPNLLLETVRSLCPRFKVEPQMA